MNGNALDDARILIVDDQEANLRLVERILEQGGYRHYRSLSDARQTFDAYEAFQPDLILLDLMMPHLDGVEVLEQLRPRIPESSYLPILVLTADVSPESKRRALAAGARDFLTKPLDAVEVLLRIKNLLETRFLYQQLQKRAAARIEEQAALLDRANDAILVSDLEDRICFWNQGAERLYGWTFAEAVGRGADELLSPRGRDANAAELEEARRAVLAQGNWSGELRQVTREGKKLVVASRWTLVRDRAAPKSRLIINTDITEKKELESRLFRTQRMEGLGTLAGGIAHDLNNVLTPILMAAEMLRDPLPEDRRGVLLRSIQASAERGAELVKQVLSFARGAPGTHVPVRPEFLMDELLKLLGPTLPKNVTLRTSVPERTQAIKGDVTQLTQVLVNLCVNARDAMPGGGAVTVSVENVVFAAAQATLHGSVRPGAYVRVVVADTGTGIAAEILDKVFDPFFTTKEIGMGTGLGLSTVLGIVRSHGGALDVRSVVDRGTEFALYFPAVEQERDSADVRFEDLPAGQGELILVADDEAPIRELMREALESYGYRVLLANDGAEAVARFAEKRGEVRLVLTDLMMPILDGATTIRVLLRIDPHARVIAVSSQRPAVPVGEPPGLGAKAFLSKPFAVMKLLKLVREVLDAPDA